jgi:hypothetical protein
MQFLMYIWFVVSKFHTSEVRKSRDVYMGCTSYRMALPSGSSCDSRLLNGMTKERVPFMSCGSQPARTKVAIYSV